MIAMPLGEWWVSIPAPEHLVGTPYEIGTGLGRRVTRHGAVSVESNAATIAFEELPGGFPKNGPFGGAITTRVQFLREVSTVQLAKNHFFGEHSAAVGRAVRENAGAVTTGEFPDLVVVTFDLSAAGWEPGNSIEYAVLKDRSGALLFDPTHYMAFDWSRLELQPKR